MSDQLDHRVTKLEYRVDGHDTDIAKITSQADTMSKALTAIQTNLTQIKWLVVGASGALALKALDLKDFLKLLLSAF